MDSLDTKTNLFITRHGETDCNKNAVVQGRGVDVPLNQTGIAQAEALAHKLKQFNIDEVYSSTLLRAKQTAKIIAKRNDKNAITYLRDLEEMSWGFYEGMQLSPELIAAFDEMKQAWSSGNYEFRIKGGETLNEVLERGTNALKAIIDKHVGKNILIVSHGRFIRILLASIMDGYNLGRMGELRQENTAFNHLILTNGRYKPVKINCIDHLDGMR